MVDVCARYLSKVAISETEMCTLGIAHRSPTREHGKCADRGHGLGLSSINGLSPSTESWALGASAGLNQCKRAESF